MKRIALISILLLMVACHKDDPPVGLSVTCSIAKPTTVEPVVCTARLTGPEGLDTARYLYRWDWEGDKVWDTNYSAIPVVSRTFIVAGTYNISVEALSEDGEVVTATQSLKVAQGYSAPKPFFTCSPDSGNFKTIFTFDASQTRDAQESISLLTFSWDFDNDQDYEVIQKANPVTTHQFEKPGTYTVNLMVKDTSKLWTRFQKQVVINRTDTLIVPVVRIVPEFPGDRDTLRMYADQSYYTGNPAMVLRYSWKKPAGAWTQPSENPEYIWMYPSNDIYQMRIRVYSEEDLYKEMEFEVVVSKSNRKPEAKIIKNMRFGNILSIYEFDAWESSDVENIPSELMARWDFEGDGIWDTQFDYNKKISHVYPSAGVYTATVQIKDQNDLTDMATTDIRVSQYTNPTSYLKDVRDQQMYGIVQIGTQWWMGENLKYTDLKNHNTPYICYQDRAQFCEATGKLYNSGAVMLEFTGETEAKNLCPRGWHVPFKDEWLVLIDEVGRETAGTALNYGGKSDFNILLGGYAYIDFDELVQDSIHRVAYFIARNNDSTLTTLQYRRDETTVQFAKIRNGYYSIRCIKDE